MLAKSVALLFLTTTVAVAAPIVTAPDSAQIGAEITIAVSGGTDPKDFVTIVPKGSRVGAYDAYKYVSAPAPLKLAVPSAPGDYEVRLLGATSPYPTLASRPLKLENVPASVQGPATVPAGTKFDVRWTGPSNERDYVAIGDQDRRYITYVYTKSGSPLSLVAPDKAGDYELRYFIGNGDKVVASQAITVGAVTASVTAPAQVAAGAKFSVQWQGPNNVNDYLTVVLKTAREGESGNWQFTARGNPAKMVAPLAAGDYELRYATGQSHTTLARAALRIAPAKQEPGLVAVTASGAVASTGAVEIILDASGSMLQRIGNQRRIDIAKQTLTKLTATILPAGTPFALRVFGRELDSCQTDLEIPVSPLNAAAVGAKIATLESKNGARTPIGASLGLIATDLGSVRGERLVVLLTDGEETCGGDPTAEIEKLKKAGVNVRVNIVGFALEDEKLAATFRHWATTGGGMFFEANDAAGLNTALSQAMRPAFEVVNAQGEVTAEGLAGGDPVSAMPGDYTVRLKGQKGPSQSAAVRAKETTTVRF